MSEKKRPPTTYPDYRDAAEVHIAACKELRKRLKADHPIRDAKDRKKIKQELYYLSGYIIECMVSFALGALLDRLNPDQNIHKENILEIDRELRIPGKEGKEQVTFRRFFRENDHSIENKLRWIKTYHIKFNVPVIGNANLHQQPDLNDKFEKLHKSWLPHHRYKLSAETESLLEDDIVVCCNLRPATCNLRPATCNLRPATCNLQPATCDLQPATCIKENTNANLSQRKNRKSRAVHRQKKRFWVFPQMG